MERSKGVENLSITMYSTTNFVYILPSLYYGGLG